MFACLSILIFIRPSSNFHEISMLSLNSTQSTVKNCVLVNLGTRIRTTIDHMADSKNKRNQKIKIKRKNIVKFIIPATSKFLCPRYLHLPQAECSLLHHSSNRRSNKKLEVDQIPKHLSYIFACLDFCSFWLPTIP